MKKGITTINPKVKNQEKTHSIIFIWIQFILTIALAVFGIITIFKQNLFVWFQLLLGITILDMGINNYLIYKRPYVTLLYIIVGILIILSFALKIIGV